jgi:hypothetical protein
MKKVITMIAAAVVASTATADIVAIDFVNLAGYEGSFAGDYTIQLVHNASDVATSVGLDLLGSGDAELATVDSLAPNAATFSSQGVGQYDIANSGEIVIRVIEQGYTAGSVGSQFVVASAAFTVYDSLNPATIYSTEGAISGGFTEGVSGEQFTVVPEPATIGLMGIASLGLFAARRKVS